LFGRVPGTLRGVIRGLLGFLEQPHDLALPTNDRFGTAPQGAAAGHGVRMGRIGCDRSPVNALT
jgi:hypothetical protein